MRAHSTGQHSTSGRSAITIPPEWMPRWRGKSLHLLGELERELGDGRAVVLQALAEVVERAARRRAPPVDPLGERVGVPG